MRSASILFFLMLTYAGASQAALGGAPEQFTTGTTTVTAGTTSAGVGYVVRDTALAGGTHVREYVSAGDAVFAVAWKGPVPPDLKALLGSYFDTMVAESAKAPLAGRGSMAINLPEVVINSGGHMRAFYGNAWIPAQLPAGFTGADVR